MLLRLIGGLLFLAVPAALAFAALAPEAAVDAIAQGGIACPFRTLTTIPCAFCHMTHAALALGAGDVAGAHRHHPLVIPVLGLWLYLCARLAWPARPARPGRSPAAAFVGSAVAVVWTVNLLNHYLA